MKDDALFFARLSKASYASDGDEAIKRLLKQSYDGWHVLDKFSDLFPWLTVIINSSGNRGVIVFRGSKNNTTDRELDKDIMHGSEIASKRFQKVASFMRALKQAAPSTKWIVVGHSSGGTMAMLLNRRFGVESHAFNPGATHNSVDIIRRLPRFGEKNGEKAGTSHIHIVPEDDLSNPVLELVGIRGMDKPTDHVLYYHQKRGASSPHDISNFV